MYKSTYIKEEKKLFCVVLETDKEGGFMAVDGQRGHAKSFQIKKKTRVRNVMYFFLPFKMLRYVSMIERTNSNIPQSIDQEFFHYSFKKFFY